MRVRWRPDTDALNGWASHCASGWAPTHLEQENKEAVYLSGTYSYAVARLSLTRIGSFGYMSLYFFVSVALVLVSYAGTFIDPRATPARVALGVITILSVLSNWQARASPQHALAWSPRAGSRPARATQ